MEAIEDQVVKRLAEELFEVRVEKARATRREKELVQRMRECNSFGRSIRVLMEVDGRKLTPRQWLEQEEDLV